MNFLDCEKEKNLSEEIEPKRLCGYLCKSVPTASEESQVALYIVLE